MSTAVTVNNIKTLFRPNLLTETAAISSVNDEAETFAFSLKASDNGVLILIKNALSTGGEIGYSFSEGILGMPADLNDATLNKIAPGMMAGVKLDSGYVMKENGEIELTITPPAGKNLAALGVTVTLIQNNLTI